MGPSPTCYRQRRKAPRSLPNIIRVSSTVTHAESYRKAIYHAKQAFAMITDMCETLTHDMVESSSFNERDLFRRMPTGPYAALARPNRLR